MSEIITDIIQQSTSRIAKPKAINKRLKSRISLPPRALMMQRRAMAENDYDKPKLKYADKKQKEDVRKYNQEVT